MNAISLYSNRVMKCSQTEGSLEERTQIKICEADANQRL